MIYLSKRNIIDSKRGIYSRSSRDKFPSKTQLS